MDRLEGLHQIGKWTGNVWGLLPQLVMAIALLLCSIEDIRRRQIHVLAALLPLPFLLLEGGIAEGGRILWNVGQGVATGVVFYGVARTTRQLGEGDAIVLGVAAVGLKFWENCFFLCMSFCYAFVFALILVVFCHAGRSKRIPFVPAIFLGYLSVLVLGGWKL